MGDARDRLQRIESAAAVGRQDVGGARHSPRRGPHLSPHRGRRRAPTEHYGWTLGNKLDHYVESYERKAREQLDAQLWRGSIDGAVGMVQAQATDQMVSDGAALPAAQAAVSVRLLLRTTSLLEGWAQMLLHRDSLLRRHARSLRRRRRRGRRACRRRRQGGNSALFSRCSVDAGKRMLRAGDGVRRDDVVSAIGRCARNLNIWAQLGRSRVRGTTASRTRTAGRRCIWPPPLVAARWWRTSWRSAPGDGAHASGLTLHVAMAGLLRRRRASPRSSTPRAELRRRGGVGGVGGGYFIRYGAATLRVST